MEFMKNEDQLYICKYVYAQLSSYTHLYVHMHINTIRIKCYINCNFYTYIYAHIYTNPIYMLYILYFILLYAFLNILSPQKVLTCYNNVTEISEINVPRYGQCFLILFV